MNNQIYRKAVPEMPLSFVHKMDETLERIEHMEKKKKIIKPRTLLICAILIVTLIGSALAASEYRVFDFLWHMQPLEGAEKLVKTHVGFTENEYVRVEIEEALYDGQGILLCLRATPRKPDTHPLYSSLADTENDPDWAYAYETYEDGSSTFTFLGRTDEKKFVSVSLSVTAADETGKEVFLNSWDAKKADDGSIIYYADGYSDTKLGDTVTLTAKVRSTLRAHDASVEENLTTGEISCAMPKTDASRKYRLVPVSEGDAARFSLIEGTLSFTPVRGYMTVSYAYKPQEDEPMGVTVKPCLPDGTEIAVGGGDITRTKQENGFEFCEDTCTLQSFETLPETLLLRIKVIGEGKYLTEIECKVIEN